MVRRNGSIAARGRDTYLVRVYLGEVNGKRHYANHTVHGSRAAAQQFLEDRLREQRTGDFVEPATLTLGDWLDRWLKHVMTRKVTPKTLRGYQDILRLYVRPRLGARRLADLTTADVQAVYTAMVDRGLSPRTVRHVHAALRPALEKAVQWRLLARNPALNADLPGPAAQATARDAGHDEGRGSGVPPGRESRSSLCALHGGAGDRDAPR